MSEKYWKKRFTQADRLKVGDIVLTGSVPPFTAHEIVQIVEAPRRRIRIYLERLSDREHVWKIELRMKDTVGITE